MIQPVLEGTVTFRFGLVRKDFKGVLGAHHEQHVHFFDPPMERSFASRENHVCIASSKNKSKYKIIIYIYNYIIIYIIHPTNPNELYMFLSLFWSFGLLFEGKQTRLALMG